MLLHELTIDESESPIVMKLVLTLRRDTLKDLAGEKESIIKIFCKILEFFLRMPDKRGCPKIGQPLCFAIQRDLVPASCS